MCSSAKAGAGCEEYFALLQVGAEADTPQASAFFNFAKRRQTQEEVGRKCGDVLRALSSFCRRIVNVGARCGVHEAHSSSLHSQFPIYSWVRM